MQAYGVRGSLDPERPLEYAPDVLRIATGIVNTYLIGENDHWVLLDTGIAGFGRMIRRGAEARFGVGTRPAAIILTHGHFDHAGNADALAAEWNAPVYAHPLELPYLNGQSDYPPPDPTVGGAMAFMSRAYPHRGRKLSSDVRPLEDGVPGLPDWRWLHTPGSTAGHISLFREVDRLLLAGDAMATMNLDSWVEQVRRTPEPANPPAPLTTDWEAARRSVEKLAALGPQAIGAGHGLPLAGEGLPDVLADFAATFTAPARGRYAVAPAYAGPSGVEWIPPPVPDPFPRQAAGAALVAFGVWGLAAAARRGTSRRRVRPA
ncbi:MAG: MBL fold metallo-hydrolase [Acidobacteria bacterium]|nr:MBL fold metallo-hydrolase [Acidobacteriota bacterium]